MRVRRRKTEGGGLPEGGTGSLEEGRSTVEDMDEREEGGENRRRSSLKEGREEGVEEGDEFSERKKKKDC